MMIFAGSVGNPFSKNRQSSSVTGDGEGVYTLEFNGKALKKRFVIKADNATTLTVSKDQKTVYVANEVRNFTGLNGSGGGITSYRILDNRSLEKLNDSISYGSRPAYVSLSESGRYLLVANHGSHSSVTCHYEKDENAEWKLKREFDDSSVAVFKVEEDGTITSFKVKEDGSLEFLEELHLNGCDPRGFMISSDRKYLFVGLLDKDTVGVYHIDSN